MSPVHRSLAGEVLAFDLGEEMRLVREELVGGRVCICVVVDKFFTPTSRSMSDYDAY